jgi:peroxiredoxin
MKLTSYFLFLFFLLILTCSDVSAESLTSIKGYAPKYIGEKVEIYAIEDYCSLKERLIASTVVKDDSTFVVNFFNSKTQKIIIKSKNNKGYLYIEPNANYEIYLPANNKYDEYRPLGNDIEISFLNLEESDINFKILSFDKWMDNFLGLYFYKKNINGREFVQQLDTFKFNVQNYYEKDTSFFLKTYIRYSIASLDEIQFIGTRSRFEKYDFYLAKYPLMYDNNVYMNYLLSYYKNIFTRLPMETNNRIYLGVLKSSPTLVANAMAEEITLKNVQILELVMIKALSDTYFKGEFPQTNVISILDSISKNSLFKQNGLIAANMIEKLTEILPGSKAPEFSILNTKNDTKTNQDYLNKHLYIQFIDLSIKECEKDIEILKPMYEKYKKDVEVITIYKKQEKYTKKQQEVINSLPWEKFEASKELEIFKKYKIETFPSYVLIDAYGYIVAAPALRPSPNGKYETIDLSFFYIQKMNRQIEK